MVKILYKYYHLFKVQFFWMKIILSICCFKFYKGTATNKIPLIEKQQKTVRKKHKRFS